MRRRLLLATRKLAPKLFNEALLGIKDLEFVQHAVGSVKGGKLDLITVALTSLKIRDPLLSPHLDMIIEAGLFL